MSSGWGIKISGPDGRQQSIQAWADELGMDHQTLRDRIARGMRPEEVLSPVRRRGAKKPRSAALPIAASSPSRHGRTSWGWITKLCATG